MLKVLTKAEVEESNRQLDIWWSELGWDIKEHLRKMVQGIQHPIDQSLPMHYADDPDSSGDETGFTITIGDG